MEMIFLLWGRYRLVTLLVLTAMRINTIFQIISSPSLNLSFHSFWTWLSHLLHIIIIEFFYGIGIVRIKVVFEFIGGLHLCVALVYKEGILVLNIEICFLFLLIAAF